MDFEAVWNFGVGRYRNSLGFLGGVLEQFGKYKDFWTVWDFWVSGYQNSLVNKMILRQFE